MSNDALSMTSLTVHLPQPSLPLATAVVFEGLVVEQDLARFCEQTVYPDPLVKPVYVQDLAVSGAHLANATSAIGTVLTLESAKRKFNPEYEPRKRLCRRTLEF